MYVALSDPESARNAYNAALTAQVSDQVDRNLVQIKLESLPESENTMTDEVTE